jgi:hypothetical protein
VFEKLLEFISLQTMPSSRIGTKSLAIVIKMYLIALFIETRVTKSQKTIVTITQVTRVTRTQETIITRTQVTRITR